MYLLSGDQVAELPRISHICSVPSVFIRNRSEVLWGSVGNRRRLLSNRIFFPSGDKAGKASPLTQSRFSVTRRTFVPSGFIRKISDEVGVGQSRVLVNAIVDTSSNSGPWE